MSDAWTPIHHEEIDADEPGSTADPKHEKPRDQSQPNATKRETSAPVGLTLDLPQDMIDAMWGAADQLKRVALALEENSALTRRLINVLTGGKDGDKSDTSGAG